MRRRKLWHIVATFATTGTGTEADGAPVDAFWPSGPSGLDSLIATNSRQRRKPEHMGTPAAPIDPYDVSQHTPLPSHTGCVMSDSYPSLSARAYLLSIICVDVLCVV
jgi:hypothetical protein